MSDEDKSLEDVIRDAYEADQQAQEEHEPEPKITTAEPEEPETPPASTTELKTPPAVVEDKKVAVSQREVKEPEATEPEGSWGEDKAPQSWTPKSRERWDQIPEDLRKEIVRREEAGVQGIRQLNERFAPVQRFFDGLSSYIGEAVHHNVDPIQHIASTMQTERALRLGDPRQKFEVLLQVADQYGVPLREIINKSVGEEVLRAPQHPQQYQMPPELAQRFQALENAYSTREAANSEEKVSLFSKGREFFEDVRLQMADMMEAGLVDNLEDAYDQACWANPSVREVLLTRQGKGAKDQEIKDRQKAASKVKSPSNTSVEVPADGENDSLEDFVRKQVLSSMSGRT